MTDLTPAQKLALRNEGRARLRIRDLEKELEPTRPSKEELQTLAEALGEGFKTPIYDDGKPIGFGTVNRGRVTLDVDTILTDYGRLVKSDPDTLRITYGRTGKPFWGFR